MTSLLRDVVVVLPGIMGSTLAKDGRLVWAPSRGAVLRAITTLGRNLKDLELPPGIGDEHPDDGVEPVSLMPDLHVVPGLWSASIGYDALLAWLRSRFHFVEAPLDDPDRFANLLPIPYDWRLSNRLNGRRLKALVEPALEKWRSQGEAFADAKLTFICHSMGGLVARWYIEREGGSELTRKLITIGTPHRGAMDAFATLLNGAHLGLGRLGLDVTQLGRSLPAMFQLLPEYACIETPRGLLKTTEADVPDLDPALIEDGMRFHQQLDSMGSPTYDLHPIVGFRQQTKTTATISGGRLLPVPTIQGEDEGGDGTVPRLSATPAGLRPDDPSVRSAADSHGSLQSSRGVLDEIEFVLDARSAPHKEAGMQQVSLALDDLLFAGESIPIDAQPVGDDEMRLQAAVSDEAGDVVSRTAIDRGEPASISPLAPGGYTITVGGVATATTRVQPVTKPVLVWER